MENAIDNATEKVDRRSVIESEYNRLRHGIEMKYIADCNELESKYRSDLEQNRREKAAALAGVGLNPDGSDPQGRQQGLAPE